MIEGSPSKVSFGGVDLSPYVTSFVFDPKGAVPDPDHDAVMAARIAGLADVTVTFRGFWQGPGPIQWYLSAARPRIRRMHAAYGRRRGQGRW